MDCKTSTRFGAQGFKPSPKWKTSFENWRVMMYCPMHQDACLMVHLMDNALLTTQLHRHTWRLLMAYKSIITHLGVTSLWCWIPQAWYWLGMTVCTTRALAMDGKPRFSFSRGLGVMKLWEWSRQCNNWLAYNWKKTKHYTTTSCLHKNCPQGSNMRGNISQHPY